MLIHIGSWPIPISHYRLLRPLSEREQNKTKTTILSYSTAPNNKQRAYIENWGKYKVLAWPNFQNLPLTNKENGRASANIQKCFGTVFGRHTHTNSFPSLFMLSERQTANYIGLASKYIVSDKRRLGKHPKLLHQTTDAQTQNTIICI